MSRKNLFKTTSCAADVSAIHAHSKHAFFLKKLWSVVAVHPYGPALPRCFKKMFLGIFKKVFRNKLLVEKFFEIRIACNVGNDPITEKNEPSLTLNGMFIVFVRVSTSHI